MLKGSSLGQILTYVVTGKSIVISGLRKVSFFACNVYYYAEYNTN